MLQCLAKFQFRFLITNRCDPNVCPAQSVPVRISISIRLVQRYRPETKTTSESLSDFLFSRGEMGTRACRSATFTLAREARETSPGYLYRRQSDFRRCKRLYMARCKGGLFDTTRPIMRRYIRRASIVNTTSFFLSLSSFSVPSPSLFSFLSLSLSLSLPPPRCLFSFFLYKLDSTSSMSCETSVALNPARHNWLFNYMSIKQEEEVTFWRSVPLRRSITPPFFLSRSSSLLFSRTGPNLAERDTPGCGTNMARSLR